MIVPRVDHVEVSSIPPHRSLIEATQKIAIVAFSYKIKWIIRFVVSINCRLKLDLLKSQDIFPKNIVNTSN